MISVNMEHLCFLDPEIAVLKPPDHSPSGAEPSPADSAVISADDPVLSSSSAGVGEGVFEGVGVYVGVSST